MQPHSTIALSLANYIYNFYNAPHNARGSIRVEYQDREGKYRSLIYSFDNLKSRGSDFRQGFSVWVKKSGDPLSCMLYVDTSDGEYYAGKHFVITHGTQHVSGLEEHFDLYQKGVRSGHHINSVKYDDFDAEFLHEKQMEVSTYLRKTKTHEKKNLRLKVKIEQINYQEKVAQKPKQVIVAKKEERKHHEKQPDRSHQHRKEEDPPKDVAVEESTSIFQWKDLLLFVVLGFFVFLFVLFQIYQNIVEFF